VRSAAPELSVVVLCYRAEDELARVVAPLHADLAASGVPCELVLVANYWPGRPDRTPDRARAFAESRDDVLVLAEPKRGDMGWDLRAGLGAANGEYLVYLDGDGQVPTRAAIEVYRRLKETGADVAKGRRLLREDGSVRSVTSIGFNVLFRLLFRTKGLWDVNGQPKGLTRAAYERLDLRTDDWFTDAEILLKAKARGFEIVEVPVHFLAKQAPGSHVGADTVWEFLVNMVRWRLGRHPAQRVDRGRRSHAVARARR
jgi:glycosyltransferase involved in cell wall biosynthesis